MRRLLFTLGTGALLIFGSCSSPNALTSVTGKVTFDGQPLPEGDILFIPADKQFGGEAGKIRAGEYQLEARPGKNEVQIRATRLVPGKLGPMGEPAIEDYIPAKYNTTSTLSVDVAPGQTKFDFDLKSE